MTMRALALDPAARFSSAYEMALALEDAIRPAPREDVAIWVKNAGGERLVERADLVSKIVALGASKQHASESEPPTLIRGEAGRIALVANLTGPARDSVVRVARTGGTIQVPLAHPPPNDGEHILEVHVAGESAPQRFRARVAGAPGSNGFR